MRTPRADLSNAVWRKSTHSDGGGGDCVEIADGFPGLTLVRDSKSPAGPVLLFPAGAWAVFLDGVKGPGLSG